VNVLMPVIVGVAASAVLVTATQTARSGQETAAAAIKTIAKDRTDTENWLRSDPSSYLAAIDRRDFGARKTLAVGRAADNDVRLDDQAVSAHHLRITVGSDTFQVSAADAQARFVSGGKALRTATLGPSSIQVGRFQLRLSHQGFPALIVFDPRSPHFREYKGLKYFPIDLGYRYELPLTASPRDEIVIVQSTRGNERRARRVGWFEFKVGATTYRLEAVRLLEPGVGENDISIFFGWPLRGREETPDRQVPAGFQPRLQPGVRVLRLLQLSDSVAGEHAHRRDPGRRDGLALSPTPATREAVGSWTPISPPCQLRLPVHEPAVAFDGGVEGLHRGRSQSPIRRYADDNRVLPHRPHPTASKPAVDHKMMWKHVADTDASSRVRSVHHWVAVLVCNHVLIVVGEQPRRP